jgi:hypothetical protein
MQLANYDTMYYYQCYLECLLFLSFLYTSNIDYKCLFWLVLYIESIIDPWYCVLTNNNFSTFSVMNLIKEEPEDINISSEMEGYVLYTRMN